LSTPLIVAMIRHVDGMRMGSVPSGASTPCGTSESWRDRPPRLKGRTAGSPESTVNSWPKARSKLERFSSSITSHRPLSMASTKRPGRNTGPSGVGCQPPMVSTVDHSEVAVVGWYPVQSMDDRPSSAAR